MLRNSSVRGLGLVVSAVSLAGVIGCGGEVSDDVEDEHLAALSTNALSVNALSVNALSVNALSVNALSVNALSVNALTVKELRDPLARELFKYIVSCALDDGDSISLRIDGKRYRFDGSLGLAPEWGEEHGYCDGSCQRWVSACVLSRVDAAGVERPISIRGSHPALRPEARELRDYTYREAAYFGNLFLKSRPMYLCLAPGRTSDQRVCGDSLNNCPMEVLGSCDKICDEESRAFGYFSECSDGNRKGREYEEVATVFLPR
jgi:hypothetical protein